MIQFETTFRSIVKRKYQIKMSVGMTTRFRESLVRSMRVAEVEILAKREDEIFGYLWYYFVANTRAGLLQGLRIVFACFSLEPGPFDPMR